LSERHEFLLRHSHPGAFIHTPKAHQRLTLQTSIDRSLQAYLSLIAIIWATAQVHGLLLITRNVRDFPPDEPGVRMPYGV